ncbi:2Fe-2S iron-sulfur cluster binding domain-containing protein [Halalkalicoccus sp. NIPERK01]|uniref:2Fe-2S iron-sulfur cluster-binding protein n=1 Tax=Halalkalicoccus sp. NIPERK01 TaxID=3053469 RepID=UPI00256EA544|nr:2Fe-2S iron-sulfur cluster binding domain-containing protein [Halalkalicoccus sp. NIPERK01]MDL5360493.1 2Fe-2S iron-sulfur cluster binding domain-containing protein [Halalkalicoccus sp. NIPERK01]
MVETHTIEFVDEGVTLEVAENESILEAAEEAGLDLPYQCRMGVCGVCSAMCEDGEADQMEGMFLSESEKDEGYVLTCIGKPRSDMRIRTNESP